MLLGSVGLDYKNIIHSNLFFMTSEELELLKYPIGKFRFSNSPSETDLQSYIHDIAELPSRLIAATHGMSEQQLDTPYRPEGWTVRQLIHHIADSHLNSYVRFKLAATEDRPTITTYEEQIWAELSDGKSAPVDLSLSLLSALHTRWIWFVRSLNSSQLKEFAFLHPANGAMTLEKALALYAWHSNHHLRHITALKERMGW